MMITLGIGGGFMERDNVEYVERDDSDDEYDEVNSICDLSESCHFIICLHSIFLSFWHMQTVIFSLYIYS